MLFCVFHTYIIRKDRCQAAGYEKENRTSGDVGGIWSADDTAGAVLCCADRGECGRNKRLPGAVTGKHREHF